MVNYEFYSLVWMWLSVIQKSLYTVKNFPKTFFFFKAFFFYQIRMGSNHIWNTNCDVYAIMTTHTRLVNLCAAFYFLTLQFRYASLYFCCAVEDQDNELITLEIIHRYVELLDKYFGSVSPINIKHISCRLIVWGQKQWHIYCLNIRY